MSQEAKMKKKARAARGAAAAEVQSRVDSNVDPTQDDDEEYSEGPKNQDPPSPLSDPDSEEGDPPLPVKKKMKSGSGPTESDASTGGLYGASSVPATLSAMPELKGTDKE